MTAGFRARMAAQRAQAGQTPWELAVLADSPQLWWRVGELAGVVAEDSSGNGKDGTYVNAPTLGRESAVLSDPNTAVLLDHAQSEYVEGGAGSAGINPALTSASIEAWVRYTGAANIGGGVNPTVVGRRNAAAGYSWLIVKADGGIAGTFGALQSFFGNTTLDSGIVITDECWHHVVVTWDLPTTTLRIYVDGRLCNSGTRTAPNEDEGWRLGTTRNLTSFWRGELDEFAVYASVLSDERVLAHYDAAFEEQGWPDVIEWTRPIAWWRLADTVLPTAHEEIQNADGVYSGPVVLGVPSLIETDPANLAVDLPGNAGGDAAMTAPTPLPGLAALELTVGSWVLPPTRNPGATQFDRIVEAGAFDAPGEWSLFYFWTALNGQLVTARFAARDATNAVRNASMNYPMDPAFPRLIMGTYDGANAKLYVDGYEAGRIAIVDPLDTTQTIILSGRSDSNDDITFDEMFVHAQALGLHPIREAYYAARPSPYRDAVLARTPRNYWRLGDFSNSSVIGILDERGTQPGTVNGAIGQQQNSALIGDNDGAFLFDGIDDRIAVGATASRPTSLTAWIRVAASAKQETIWSNRSGGISGRLVIYLDAATGQLSAFHHGQGSVARAGPALDDNAWHMVGYTYDGTNVRLYVDGALVGTIAIAAPAASAGQAWLGHDPGNAVFLTGTLDEAALFDDVLTDADVAAIYAARLG